MCSKCVYNDICKRYGFINNKIYPCPDFLATKELQAWYVKVAAAKLIDHYGKKVYYERYHKKILRILKELEEE